MKFTKSKVFFIFLWEISHKNMNGIHDAIILHVFSRFHWPHRSQDRDLFSLPISWKRRKKKSCTNPNSNERNEHRISPSLFPNPSSKSAPIWQMGVTSFAVNLSCTIMKRESSLFLPLAALSHIFPDLSVNIKFTSKRRTSSFFYNSHFDYLMDKKLPNFLPPRLILDFFPDSQVIFYQVVKYFSHPWEECH